MPEISGMIQQFLEGNIKTLSGPEPVIESKTITENGTYTAPEGVDGYSPVVVNVEPVIESKTITENGTYTAPEGVDGYSPVVVNVPPTEPVIESKNITENGTYTAPEGVDGYSPITVDVPQTQPTLITKSITDNGTYNASDDNADGYSSVTVNVPPVYVKEVPNLPASIASFSDGAVGNLADLKVAIEPVQDLSHGDPSPTNICPISGWTEANVTVADDVKKPTVSHTYTIDLDGTRYGGTLDVVSGVLTVDRIKWTLTPTVSQIAGVSISDCIISIPADKTPIDWNVSVNKCMCNKLKVSNYSAQHNNHVHFPNSSIIALYLEDEVGTTKQDWVDYLAQAQIDVSYIIATPTTIQLTPTQVTSLLADNNIYADCGQVVRCVYPCTI